MAEAGYEITETGLVVRDGWTAELWEAAGHEIARYQKGLMWLIGDWLNAGDREGYVERGRLAEACERFGIAYGTAKNAAMVAAAFDKRSLRRDLLDFGHHQAVANHPPTPRGSRRPSRKVVYVDKIWAGIITRRLPTTRRPTWRFTGVCFQGPNHTSQSQDGVSGHPRAS